MAKALQMNPCILLAMQLKIATVKFVHLTEWIHESLFKILYNIPII